MMTDDITVSSLFNLTHSLAGGFLSHFTYPWQAIPHISRQICIISKSIEINYREVMPGVFIHPSAAVSGTACICAPCIIGANAQVRHGAYIRGSVLIGDNCVVGNSTELKNCILFDGVQAPHFNYIGDSILGFRAHLGAGAILSNVKGDRSEVSIRCEDCRFPTGLKKCGSFLGDGAEIGCNSVLNPGSVVGRRARLYPLVSLRGCVPEGSVIKK